MLDLICGFSKLTMNDFDGKISATIFLGTCNFRCPFCHNSGLVLDVNSQPREKFEDILAYLKTRRGVIEAVCVTGGEPTLYPDLEEMITKIKELGYIVKLDTNGTNPDVIKNLYEKKLIDYVAMDIKNSLRKYPITVGKASIDLNNIKESINFLMNSGIDYEFRTTIVRELHDADDIQAIGMMLRGAKKYFLQKFIDNDNCISSGLHEVNIIEAKEYLDILSKYIEKVSLRSYE